MAVTVFRGDKVVLMKSFDKMQNIGNMYEVADFTNTNIVLRDCATKVAACAVSITDFSNYSDKAENVIGKWTHWHPIIDGLGDVVCFYRTNFKKIEVRIFTSDKFYITAKATCCKNDNFNMGFGIHLAYLRAIKKQCEIEKNKYENKIVEPNEEYESKIAELNEEIGNVTNNIEKMCRE